MNARRRTLTLAIAALLISACGDDVESITLVAYDSYPADDPDEPNPLQLALDEFTAETGVEVELLVAGDTGTMLAKAELTAGNPEGDVMWGIDNTFLSRAVDAGVFEPYESNGLDAIGLPAEFTRPRPRGRGDAGRLRRRVRQLRHRRPRFDGRPGTADPTFADLADARLRRPPRGPEPGDVVARTRVPARHDRRVRRGRVGGRTGSRLDRQRCRASSTTGPTAYYAVVHVGRRWLPAARRERTARRPPFEVLFAAEPLAAAPTGVVEPTPASVRSSSPVCSDGTDSLPTKRRACSSTSSISERFQREVPLNLFVFPVDQSTSSSIPSFVEYATIPEAPLVARPGRDRREPVGLDRSMDRDRHVISVPTRR